jgi:hypothetical protein
MNPSQRGNAQNAAAYNSRKMIVLSVTLGTMRRVGKKS